jgi:hypothetical protein
MRYTATILILLFALAANAQQWIVKKYDYDSTLNVHYGTAIDFNGNVDSMEMDIYTPICDDASHLSRRPMMVWIHGGAFVSGNKEEMTYLAKEFVQRGYVTATINYRLGFVSDDTARTCNYPNYSCAFATHPSEWVRAYYRGIQDAKGALRFLVNRHAQYRIDTNNVFVAGESAGAFIALGVALLDTAAERMPETQQLNAVPRPHNSTFACSYNANQSFPNTTIPRPDLGGIDGAIEPTSIQYTIKGIGNNYGGMLADLLQLHQANRPKPAIYSFHQPCDLVVPIDSGIVYQLLNWCFGNGYNCYGVANTPKVYGSRGFSGWNANNNYGYTIHDEFTTVNFPYVYLFGTGSCVDQVNTPCHAYDNRALRTGNLAAFFAPLITTNPICDTTLVGITAGNPEHQMVLVPNPATEKLHVKIGMSAPTQLRMFNLHGIEIFHEALDGQPNVGIDLSNYPKGWYILQIENAFGERATQSFLKM